MTMHVNSSKRNEQPISSANVVLQAALSIGAVNDPLEKEADMVAERVMRMPTNGLIQRKCTACEKEEKVQRKPLVSFIQKKGIQGGMVASDSVSNRINSSRGKGSGLPGSTKSFMESGFGTDFSNVNIHTGGEAVQMNRELNAKAFTVGNDIYFNKGQYNPGSNEGKHLLAHELTHTVQQGKSNKKIQREQLGDLGVIGAGIHYRLDAAMSTFAQLAGHYGVTTAQIQLANPDARPSALRIRQLITIPIIDAPSGAPSATGAQPGVVMNTSARNLNIRWGSGTGANIIGTVQRGTSVNLISGNQILISTSSLVRSRLGVVAMLQSAGYIVNNQVMGYLPSASNIRSASATVSTSDTDLLARMIWGEQRSQGHDAMVAAGWVARNRYLRGWGTYTDILNTGQFHGIVLPSAVQGLTGSDLTTWNDAQQIAQGIVAGTIADTTGGFLFFGNGSAMQALMRTCARSNSSFSYLQVGGSNLYISNLDYTGC